MLIPWPLVRKFGKRKVTVIGFTVAAFGSFMVMLAGNNMVFVLSGLLVKSTGCLPAYATSAILAEALDHVEHQKDFRTDGFSASVNSIAQSVVIGLSQSILLFGINTFGYITPESTVQVIIQPNAIHHFFHLVLRRYPHDLLCCMRRTYGILQIGYTKD